MRQILTRIDNLVVKIERLVVLVFLTIMSATVFFDVVHRVSASPTGVIQRLLVALWPGEPSPETLDTIAGVGVPLVIAGMAWFFCYGALRTARGSTMSAGKAAIIAVGLTALLAGADFLLLKLFPNGLVWSQPLALGMLLWVALLGSTLAAHARTHIILEAAEKLWPPAARRYTRLVGGFIAGAFTLMLLVLSLNYTSDFYEQWQTGVGYLAGVRVPKWMVLASMPVCFTLLSVRFIAYAIGDFLAAGRPTEEA